MATNEHIIKIPGRIKNSAIGGHVAGTLDILDDVIGRDQQYINSDTYRKRDTYNREQINSMISTPPQEFENCASLEELPETGDPHIIYRVAGDEGYYEYAWDGNQYIQISDKSYLVTDEVFELTKYKKVTVDNHQKIIDDTLFGCFYGLTKADYGVDGIEYELSSYEYSCVISTTKYSFVVLNSEGKIISSALSNFYGMNDDRKETLIYIMLYSDVDNIFEKRSADSADIANPEYVAMFCDSNMVPKKII